MLYLLLHVAVADDNDDFPQPHRCDNKTETQSLVKAKVKAQRQAEFSLSLRDSAQAITRPERHHPTDTFAEIHLQEPWLKPQTICISIQILTWLSFAMW